MASARNTEMYKVALKQAEKEYENAQKQVTALEEEAVRALTGESALDLSVINTMIIKHRAKRDTAAQTIEEARARLEQEQMSQKETQAQIDEMLSWADCYDKANIETRHMIIARIIEKVEIRANRRTISSSGFRLTSSSERAPEPEKTPVGKDNPAGIF